MSAEKFHLSQDEAKKLKEQQRTEDAAKELFRSLAFQEETENLTEEQKAEQLLRSLEDQKAFPEEARNQDEKEQAEEMLAKAIYELQKKISPVYGYSEIDSDEFEDWFSEFTGNVAAKFPDLKVVLTEDVQDALYQARVLYHVSNGSEMSQYGVASVLKEIIEIRTPKEQSEKQ